jgi:hypothetical protein
VAAGTQPWLSFPHPGTQTGRRLRRFLTLKHDRRMPPQRLSRHLNTAGGNIAEGFVHGIGLVLEAVGQICGTSASQVPGADVSLMLCGQVAPLVSATVFGSSAI